MTMPTLVRRAAAPLAGALMFAVVAAMGAFAACSDGAGRARAEVVRSRSQLVGGPDALGDVGDLKLSNGKVRFVIQGLGDQVPGRRTSRYSRGWGVYAGSLLDADLVRPASSVSSEPQGRDQFGELFPAYFLEAIQPEEIVIGNDGSNGAAATVEVRGTASPFLTMARTLLDAMLDPGTEDNPRLRFKTVYSLGPSDQFLTITSSLVDDTGDHKFSGEIMGLKMAVPMGHVLLFGARNSVFVPGAGFDLRYALDAAYKRGAELPALPGLVTDLVATRASGVSYGMMVAKPDDPDTNYTWRNRAKMPSATPTTMLVPFFATAFTGVFEAQPPDVLPMGEEFSYTSYFLVGNGDVGSLRDLQYSIQKEPVGRFVARVTEEHSAQPVADVSVVVLGPDGKPFSQYTPDAEGRVTGTLPPGRYKAVVVSNERGRTAPVSLDIEAGKTTHADAFDRRELVLRAPQPAVLNVRVYDEQGRPVPAKVSVVGTYEWNAADAGRLPREFLFDLALGERFRSTDGLPDTAADPATRRFLERVVLTDVDGRASARVRPGRYLLYASRGPEYEALPMGGEVELVAGAAVERSVVLRRLVRTPGAISGDLHVHTANSIDATISTGDRVLSYAAEGVEFIAATDHNFVTDLQPDLQRQRLGEWVNTGVGLEMTTLEMGHFNAFPLRYQPGAVTHGSFDWVDAPPGEIFQGLRSLGGPATIVQVNHPRDTIMGYFNQFNVDPETGVPTKGSILSSPNGPAFGPDKFSPDFDAIEVFNGKRFEMLRTFRMPAVPPPEPYAHVPLEPGGIVREPCAQDKPDCDYSKQPVAFPGVVEDWFVLLNKGRPVTATGNSDSHGQYLEEAGSPRNWFHVGKDSPRDTTPDDVAKAVRDHRVSFSNGPYIEATLVDAAGRTCGIGGIISEPQQPLRLQLRVQAAPWVRVDKVVVEVNGDSARRVEFPVQARADRAEQFATMWEVPRLAADAWIVVSAEGSGSLWPYVVPSEQPPVAISDAVGAIAGPLGLGSDALGNLHPAEIGPTTPYAMTNPLWIDVTGPAGRADGVSFGRGRDGDVVATPQGLTASGKTERKPKRSDLRSMLFHWGHAH